MLITSVVTQQPKTLTNSIFERKTMTTENTEVQDTEVKNPAALLAKTKELLSKLKQSQEDLSASQTALDAAKTDAAAWRKAWHDVAIIAPLDASLEAASTGPVRYLRAELLERGILKLEKDDQGTERPVLFFLSGERSTVTDPYKFLCSLKDPELNKMLRGSAMTGSGSASSAYSFNHSQPAAEPVKAAPLEFGLR